MKRTKKQKDIRQKYMVSEKQMQKMREEVATRATSITGILYLSALAEKGWTEDEIVELFETVSRYVNYIDDHLVKLEQVQEIIERRTGIKIECKW